MDNYDDNFTLLNNRVYLGNVSSEKSEVFSGSYDVKFPDGVIRFSLKGKTGLGYNTLNNYVLKSVKGVLNSYDASDNIIDSVTIDSLNYNEKISLDGKRHFYSYPVQKGDLYNDYWGNARQYSLISSVGPGVWRASGNNMVPNNSANYTIIDELGRNFIFSEGLNPVKDTNHLLNNGDFCVIDQDENNYIYIKNTEKTTNDDLRAWLLSQNELRYIACLKYDANLTESTFDNELNTVFGGRLEFIPNNDFAPENSFVPEFEIKFNRYLLSIDYADKEPEYETAVININNGNSMSGLAKFKISGISSCTLRSPYELADKERQIYTTKGKLYTQIEIESETETLSYVDATELYGNSEIKDYITESEIVRNFSDNFYLKSTWDWIYIDEGVVFPNANQNRKRFKAELNSSEFLDFLPYQWDKDTLPCIIPDYCNIDTYNNVIYKVIDGNNAPRIGFCWDNTINKYIVIVSVYYSHVSDISSFISLIINSTKTHFRYRLQTPIISGLTNKLITKDNFKFHWIKETGDNYLDYGSIELKYPLNVINKENTIQLVKSINALNYAVQNIEVNETVIGFPDGVTDNSQILQDAIDRASRKGTMINLTGGIYKITSSLYITSGVEINGNGVTTIKCETPNEPAFIVAGEKCINCTIKNLTIQMPVCTELTGGIYLDGKKFPRYISIENVTVKGSITPKETTCIFENADVDKTCGVLALPNGGQIYKLEIINCTFTNMYCGLYNEGATPTRATLSVDYIIWGMRIKSMAGEYIFNGHNNSLPDPNDPSKQTNLTKAAVYCNGGRNYFRGFLYDPQRADHTFYFDYTASGNIYQSTILYSARTNYNEELVYFDGARYGYYNVIYDMVVDYGVNNRLIEFDHTARIEPFVGGYSYKGEIFDSQSNTTTTRTTFNNGNMHGMQDNAFANCHLYGNLTCNSALLNGSLIGDIFSTNGGVNGFNDGVIFEKIPTEADPVIIELDLPSGRQLNCCRFGIQWGKFIAKDFSLYVYDFVNNRYELYQKVRNNTDKMFWKVSNYPYIDTIRKLKIEIYSGMDYSYTEGSRTYSYNPDKKVSISTVWATDTNKGGKAFLSTAGGELFGDININGLNVKAAIEDLQQRVSALEGQ